MLSLNPVFNCIDYVEKINFKNFSLTTPEENYQLALKLILAKKCLENYPVQTELVKKIVQSYDIGGDGELLSRGNIKEVDEHMKKIKKTKYDFLFDVKESLYELISQEL